MLLRELVEKKRVSFHEGFENWEEAVRASCVPLLEDHSIEEEYVQAVIDCVKKYGPYIVFAPDIAMPHSQEGAVGVNDTAICFMKVEKPVHFEKDNPEKDARLFFVLASKDHDIHVKNMEKLAKLLLTPGIMEKLLEAKKAEDLLEIDKLVTE